MKKILLFVLLAILLVGCQTPKIQETQQPVQQKVIIPETKLIETKPVVTKEIAIAQFFFRAGETKTVMVGQKEFEIKLLTLSNRAKFLINAEVTKEISVGGVDVIRGGHEVRVLKIYKNFAADVEITVNP